MHDRNEVAWSKVSSTQRKWGVLFDQSLNGRLLVKATSLILNCATTIFNGQDNIVNTDNKHKIV